jgi:sugar phosphate isomerase/epimerase
MLSISTSFNFNIKIKDQLPMIREAGFTHVCLGGKPEHTGYLDKKGIVELKKLLDDNNLKVCTVHAPFPREFALSCLDEEISFKSMDLLKRCIDSSLYLNAGALTFHPLNEEQPFSDKSKEILITRIYQLLEYIGYEKLYLTIENLPSQAAREIAIYALEHVTHEKLKFCFDTSHDNLIPPSFEILKQFGNRLFSTHISDNYGKGDDHLLPFMGTYDWERFAEVFPAESFKGVFLLETDMTPSEFHNPRTFLEEAYKRGCRLKKMAGLSID